jgi:hypothetical protein
MGFKLQLIIEIELPDLNADGKTDLSDVTVAVNMLDGVVPETHIHMDSDGITAEVTNRFPVIDVTGDKKVDLSDVSRIVSMFEKATVSTRLQMVK